jgi:peptidoglycan/LPS O-acetylase OafA/YrhL
MNASRDSANLDLLRSLAVGGVLADHILENHAYLTETSFHPWDWYLGRCGVLMFFVHTSLVLMMSLERSKTKVDRLTLQTFVAPFYLRRIFRIYPLSLLCVAIVLGFQIPPNARTPEFEPVGTVAIASNILLTQNLTYSPSLLAPMWSLPLEVQMYALLPFVFLFVGSGNSVKRAVLAWGVAIGVGLAQPHVSGRLSVAQFGPCFLAGVLAYVVSKSRKPLLPSWLWPLSAAALVGVYVLAEDFDRATIHSSTNAWLFCLLLGLVLPRFAEQTHQIVVVCSQFVAKYSYGIYLFHTLCLWIVFRKLQLPASAGAWVLFGLFLVILSAGAYRIVENPMIVLGGKLAAQLASAQIPQPAEISLSPETNERGRHSSGAVVFAEAAPSPTD